ncbi:MAG: type II secretion system protein [Campylobacterales bacterium]|nr:type II secretion system protein [Campylobacterales bacterium]
MKKSFTLIELLFSIAIIATITFVAIPKLIHYLDDAKVLQVKNDLINIKNGIASYHSKTLLKGENRVLETLEDDQTLFSAILEYQVDQTIWSKLSNTSYQVQIKEDSTIFTYDFNNLTFECNNDDSLCAKINQ